DAVLIIQIDMVDSQPLQAGVTGLEDVVGPAIHAQPSALCISYIAKLCGKHDFVAAVANSATNKLLVVADAIHVSRIEDEHAEFNRTVNYFDRFVVVARAVELAHSHAAEAKGRNREVL